MTWRVSAALATFLAFDVLAIRAGISQNIFWAPTRPERAFALAVVVAPLLHAIWTLVRHLRRSATPRQRSR